jgi:hypothetical protein
MMAEVGGDGGSGGTGEGAAGAGTEGQTGAGSGAQGQQSQGDSLLDWRMGFAENVRNAPIIQRHTSVEALAKTAVEQDSMLGRALFLPKEAPETDEYRAGMQKIYDKLGRPEKADAYELTAPEGRELDAEMTGRWKNAFHKAGLSQAQVAEVMNEYWRSVEYADNIRQGRRQESYQEGRNKLFAEFGANTEREIALFRHFANHFGAGAFSGEGGKMLLEQLEQATMEDGSRLINSPYLVATFAEAARRIGEADLHDSSFYQPGQDTAATMDKRHAELTAKQFDKGGLTADETREMNQLAQQLTRVRERQQGGRAA